jgi:hypothetical protein
MCSSVINEAVPLSLIVQSYQFAYPVQGYIQHQVVFPFLISRSVSSDPEASHTALLLVLNTNKLMTFRIVYRPKSTYALTIGTIMTTSKTQIPIPMMIRIRISFHLLIRSRPYYSMNSRRDIPHLLSNTVGSPSKSLCRDGEVIYLSVLESLRIGKGWGTKVPVLSCRASNLSPRSATFVMFWCIT